MHDQQSAKSEHACSEPPPPPQAQLVLEYRSPDKPKPLLSRIDWRRFWHGFLFLGLYAPVAATAWVFYADFCYSRRLLTPPPPHEVFAGALALIFVLLVVDIHRRTHSWSFVCGAAVALLLAPVIVIAVFFIALSMNRIH